jgi:hypothetical protein
MSSSKWTDVFFEMDDVFFEMDDVFFEMDDVFFERDDVFFERDRRVGARVVRGVGQVGRTTSFSYSSAAASRSPMLLTIKRVRAAGQRLHHPDVAKSVVPHTSGPRGTTSAPLHTFSTPSPSLPSPPSLSCVS